MVLQGLIERPAMGFGKMRKLVQYTYQRFCVMLGAERVSSAPELEKGLSMPCCVRGNKSN